MIKKFDVEVINLKVCLEEIIKKLKVVMLNVVKKGMGFKFYLKDFLMVGKIGIVKVNYGKGEKEVFYYVFLFVGYFLVDYLKYFCIVVVYKFNIFKNNYYGVDVVGLVFKRIV